MARVVMSVSLPPNLGRMVQEEAESRGIPVSVVIREALLAYFNQKKMEEKGSPEEGGPEGFPTRGEPQIEEIGVSKSPKIANKDTVSWLKQFDTDWLKGLWERTHDPLLKEQVEGILRERGAFDQ